MGQHTNTGRAIVRLNPEDSVSNWKKIKVENLQDYKVLRHEHLQAHFKNSSSLPFWEVFHWPLGSVWLPSKDDFFFGLVEIMKQLMDQRTLCEWQVPIDVRGMVMHDFLRDRCQVILFHFNRTPLKKFLMKMDAFEKRLNALLINRSCLLQLQSQVSLIQWSLRTAFVFEKRLQFLAPSCQLQALPSVAVPTPRDEDVPPVFEDVDHMGEPAAARDLQLLEEQAQQQWVEHVEEQIQKDQGVPEPGAMGVAMGEHEASQEPERVFLLPYTRAPREFMDALVEGPDLKPIREKMTAANCPCVLKGSAAKVFVSPEHYSTVLACMPKLVEPLRASHVIISESLLPCLEAAVSRIPSSKNVRVKTECIQDIGGIPVQTQRAELQSEQSKSHEQDDEEEDQDWEYVWNVERTFLCFVPELRDPKSVTQSTTEVHGGGVNPRRKLMSVM